MYETLSFQIKDQIATITLNRPDKLNALNQKVVKELLEVLDRADHDDGVRVIVLTGKGRAFCAGVDLSEGDHTFDSEHVSTDQKRDIGGILTLRIYHLQKPIIAAINGSAVGVGLTMTLPMDIRILSEEAKIGFVFSRRGIGPESCSGWFLPKIVGITRASEWVLTGRMIAKEEALASGLVSSVVKQDMVASEANKIAREIVDNTSATSVAFSRQLLWRMLGEPHPVKSHELESKFLHWAGSRSDAKEGVNSFLQKRKPTFTLSVSKDMPNFFEH